MNLYYKIWVDAIVKMRSLPANKGLWKFYSITFISTAMAVNLALIIALIQRHILRFTFYQIKIDIFPGTKIDALISFFILYFSIPLVINYFLIFKNNRYELLIEKYKSYNGKLCAAYLVISYFLPLILLYLSYFITKYF